VQTPRTDGQVAVKRYEAFQIASQIAIESRLASFTVCRLIRTLCAYQWAAHQPSFQEGLRQWWAAHRPPDVLLDIVALFLA
jgi:hypothetical protein